jgi:hypothetical protein
MFLYDRFSITGGGINGYFSVYGDIEKKHDFKYSLVPN